MRASLRCLLTAALLLGASPVHSNSSVSSSSSSSTNATTLPHCSDFQSHCELNATTASCAFHESVAFRCGAHAVGNATSVDVECRWELTGDLVLSEGVRVEIQGDDCALQLSVGKMLVLQPQAALHAASVSVHASFVRLETAASIQARVNSTEVRGRSLLFTGDAHLGASHGGSGGKRVFVNETTGPDQQIFGAFFDTRSPGPEALRAAGAWDLEALWETAMAKDDGSASFDAALMLLGSGSKVSNNSVAGGGRVRVVASRDLVMMAGASIIANGEAASCESPATGGGSGGSVFVSATALSLTDSLIHARGGDACCVSGFRGVTDCVPGGGGGRVHVAYVSSQLDDHAIDVSGGSLIIPTGDSDADLRDRLTKLVHPVEQRALSGAGGTYLRVVRSSKSSKTSGANPASEAALVLTNRQAPSLVLAVLDGETEDASPASIGGGAVTPVIVDKSHRRLDNLVIGNGAAVSTSVLYLPTGDLDIHNGSFLLDTSVSSSSLSLVSPVTSLSSESDDETVTINARNILATGNARVLLPHHGAVVRADAVSLDASVLLRFTKCFTVSSVNNLHSEARIASETGEFTLVGGKDVYVGGLVAVGSLAIHANGSLAVDAASLDASQPAVLDARFQPCNPKQFQTDGASITSAASVASFLSFAKKSNFTMLLQASQSILIGTAATSSSTPATSVALTASAVLLCAQEEISLGDDAFVSSSGRGQLANQGPGSGDCVGSVGGGGGYGGRGADSSAVNELGDYAGGGLAYGTRGGIGMLGSGGGCVDGGAGGGVVVIGARGVVLDGQVHCNGNGGINSGGGGSGGFLGLTIADYLKGHGRISAVGGGAMCLELTDKKLREIGEDVPVATVKSNTTLLHTFSLAANDAAAAAVAETATAVATTKRVCGGGGGGGRLQLHGCEQNDVDKCTSGFEGNYTVSGGATSLTSHVDSGGEAQADKGTVVPAIPVIPTKTPDDVKPAASGSFVGFPCPPGSGGLFCRVCVPGSFKAESNSEECLACKNAPSNAHYVGYGSISEACMWTCDPGYSGDLCVSPIQQLLDACGGFLGFAVVLLSIVGFLILLGFACRSRKEPGYTRNVGGGRPGGRGGIPGGAASTKGERQHLLSAAIASTQRSRFAFLLRWLYWPRVGYPKLVERDLHEHMARIYFSGVNDRDAPLKLRLTVPPQLQSVLYDGEFRLLAERINAVLAWPTHFFGSWGEAIYRLVVLLCLPGASAVLAYRRHLRVNALKRIIARYNHACMKGPRARGLLNALKLGYSGDYSLVYLELLNKESLQSACVPTTKIGKPSLPIVLLFAGRGTYESPFYLDPSDLLVRSIPQCPELTAFIDEPWIEFVAELNELLRVVSREEVLLVETLLPVAQFLENKMATVSAGTAGAGKLGGLRIYLGRFYVGDDVDCGEEFKLGILLTTASAESGGGVYAFEPTSQAQSLTGSSMAPTSGGRGGGYGTYNTRALDSMDGYGRALPTEDALLAYDSQSGGWSYAPAPSSSGANPNSRAYVRRGSIGNGSGPPSHKSTVSSIREEALRIRSNTSGSVDNLFLNGGGHLNDFDSPEMFNNHPRSGRVVEGRRGGRSNARRRRRQTFYEGWLGPVDGSLPVPGVLISADELDDRLSDRTKQQLLESFLRRFFLPTNVPQSRWLSASWMVHGALLGLLMVDLAITFAMVVNLRCVTNGEVDTECSATILMPVLLLPPLTLFLAPIMGIVSLAIASNSFSRRYSIWNALSMVNVAVAILVCLTQSRRLVAPWFTAPLPLLPAIAMLVKSGEAYVIERYIAFQETYRRRRGWRGLTKRRLSDASIPPESPYSSPVSSDNVPSYITTGHETTTFR